LKSFKEWLSLLENGTTTSSVATFKMPIGIGLIRRNWPKENKKNE
jgi:hypothetical protein